MLLIIPIALLILNSKILLIDDNEVALIRGDIHIGGVRRVMLT